MLSENGRITSLILLAGMQNEMPLEASGSNRQIMTLVEKKVALTGGKWLGQYSKEGRD